MFKKDPKSIYIYEVFFAIRFLLKFQNKKFQLTNEIFTPIGIALQKSIHSAFEDSLNILKEHEKGKEKEKEKDNDQEKIRRSWSKQMSFALHKMDTKICSLEIIERKIFYCIKFRSRYHKTVAIFSMILYIISQGKRKTIGYNPKVKKINHAKYLNNKYIPLPIIPNVQFLELYEDISKLKQSRISLVFPKFWHPYGINFLVSVVVSRQYPIVPGYLKVRNDRLIIGIKGSDSIKTHFRNKIQLSKRQENYKIINIFWHKTNLRLKKHQEKTILIAMSKMERNIIIKTINYFIGKYNESEIAKQFKKNFH
ncbi:hypothetical protein M0812_03238 [Anaeramoeba flamelloides]|uniref:Uncharacterized protein n=1 Tax=Anaeramoeba flamelloides TaxID=1746091 RepID=A0AAV8AD14_9EUKA|nr:hypothetical protein M0812_03238 [Anaeramoeba flamelloides]